MIARPAPEPLFGGPVVQEKGKVDFSPMAMLLRLMKDGEWRTLQRVHQATDIPLRAISAAFRAFATPEGGNHLVEKRHVGARVYEYRIIVRGVGA